MCDLNRFRVSAFPLMVISLAGTFACVVALFPSTARPQTPVDTDAEVDLFALTLVAGDLSVAGRQMTVHDPNEDGFIDAQEQSTLQWRDSVKDYDMNRDGKLTHLELAVRQAKLRDGAGITEFDLNNVKVYLRRHDANRNGQLDPDEIAKGWPDEPSDFDADKNGVITSEEMARQFAFMRGLRREMGIESVDQTRAISIVKRNDADNDKKLDVNERVGARLPLSASRFDDDGDDRLSIMEVATLFSRHRRDLGLTVPDQKKINSLMQRDFDGDGKLADRELQIFGNESSEQFTKFDADKDGEITLQEIETHFAAVRKNRGYGPKQFNVAVRLIQRHDANKSKHIEPSELHDSAAKGKLSKDILPEADLNKDGRIGLDELSRYLVKHPQD
ncbi:hypothetical protein [Stieleria marina]|uniref:EF hand n=1 Tax=Stieleria marina TaxID=1930275 RepID=A0A517NQQ2_9BACT|nr:EF hand [Planctomycetes bacterium K23_9]